MEDLIEINAWRDELITDAVSWYFTGFKDDSSLRQSVGKYVGEIAEAIIEQGLSKKENV